MAFCTIIKLFGNKQQWLKVAIFGSMVLVLVGSAYQNKRKKSTKGINSAEHHTKSSAKNQDTYSERMTKALIDRVNDLTSKLSAEMGKKVAADESSVENVNIKNRPMNIADEYVHFCSNEWLNAKTALDEEDPDGLQEVDKVQLLFNIVMVTETEIKELHCKLMGDIQRRLYDPTYDLTSPDGVHVKGNEFIPGKGPQNEVEDFPPLPLQVTNALGDFLRTQADEVKLDKIHKDVVRITTDAGTSRSTDMNTLWLATRQNQHISQYISACLRLCWKMATQRPPMAFKIADKYLGDKFHELYWKSEDPAIETQAKLYHVFPMLYHGPSLMAKGKVYLVK